MIYQSESAECGLACLAIISGIFGYNIDLHSLRQRFPLTLKGCTLEDLISISEHMNLSGRALKLELDDLNKLKTPCIIHWDLNHFVVLKKVYRKKIIIMDPASGLKNYSISEVGKHFTGIALELTPTHKFEKKDVRQKISLEQLIGKTQGLLNTLSKVLVLSLILQVLTLVSPYYLQLVIDEVVVSYDNNLLSVLAIGFFLILILNLIVNILRSYVIIHLGYSLSQHLAINLFNHLIRLPVDFFSNRHLGDIVSRFRSLDRLRNLVTNQVVEAILDGFMSIVTLMMLFIYSIKLTMIVLIAMLFYILLRVAWFHPLQRYSEESIIATANENTEFMESIRGVTTIKLSAIESSRQSIWQNKYVKSLYLSVKLKRLNVIYNSCKSFLLGAENIIVIYLGAHLIINSNNNDFTVGMLTAFIFYKLQFTKNSSSFIEKIIEFKMAGIDINRISDIILTKREDNQESKTIHNIIGQVEIKDISFRYSESEHYVLKNINININPGERLVITGKSGVGKSTLIKIILGILRQCNGDIYIDGINIKDLGYQQFRKQVSSVMQDDQLFSGSIIDNISLSDPQVDFNHAYECARIAAIDNSINSMPMKYNTLIGDMGTVLSEGQKQRILLARALYRKPKILFLDEYSSNLDLKTESIINENLRKMKITQIMVAHRKEVISLADHILEITSPLSID